MPALTTRTIVAMGRSGGQRKTQAAGAVPRPTASAAAPASPQAQLETLGWKAPAAVVEPDGDNGYYLVNANGLGRVDRQKTVGWHTATPLTRREAEAVAARADEISLIVANGGDKLADSYSTLASKHAAGGLLAAMFGPRPGQAPYARFTAKLLDDGSLEIREYDFGSWQTTLPAV